MKIKKKMKIKAGDMTIFHKCTKDHNHILYYSWEMACDGCNCFFFIVGYFLPFYYRNSPKNQNFKKMKKLPGDIILLLMCTKIYD